MRYRHHDFHVAFSTIPESEAAYKVRFRGRAGVGEALFDLPFTKAELARRVVAMASQRRRSGSLSRDAIAQESAVLDAREFGGRLAEALFTGPLGAAYDEDLEGIAAVDVGLRLTLSFDDAPALANVPWEMLFRRPTFMGVQPHLPIVRRFGRATAKQPPTPDVLRILGVVASPENLPRLDVDRERALVEGAISDVRATGRVQIDWLDRCTPRQLQVALRDGRFNILYFIGHGDLIESENSTEGFIYLEDNDTRLATPVDGTLLANLLADQATLRLVVLNSCEGARTTLADPLAGVAHLLTQLGVPAVVAMQFEISDEAAIVFAHELFTNLILRQDPIDAAVSEARKAVLVETNKVEWATPVLFMNDPRLDLFGFAAPDGPVLSSGKKRKSWLWRGRNRGAY